MQQVTRPTFLPAVKLAIVQRFMPLVKAQFVQPVFASLAQNRKASCFLIGVAALQLVLVSLGLPAWPCPVRAALGIPCPGCDLSSAIILLVRGDWRAAISVHAFAPIFLLGGGLLMGVSLLPGKLHRATVGWIASQERRTGITTCVLASLVVYWGLRLIGVL